MAAARAPQRKPAATTANAGAFSGYWVCDKARSDSPRPHLQTIGLPELAIGAAEKLNMTLWITHVGRELTVAQLSELGCKERKFTFGEEFREPSRDGGTTRFLVDLVSPTEVQTVVHMGQLKLSEKKVLQGPNLDLLVQTVVMSVKGSSVTTTTTRVFVRQGLTPPPDAVGLP